MFTIYSACFQDVGLYVCGARNAVNKDGDKESGVVYLNMEKGTNSSTVRNRMQRPKDPFDKFVKCNLK